MKLRVDRFGFTLIELVVALAIIGVLVAIILPAVQAARSSSRRTECASHLRQIGLALSQYIATYDSFPNGAAHKSQLLPYLDQQNLFRDIEGSRVGRTFPDWEQFKAQVLPIYLCPTDPTPTVISEKNSRMSGTNYAACSGTGLQRDGTNGIFNIGFTHALYPGGYVKPAGVRDGFSNTAAFAEILRADGTHHRLRTNWKTLFPMTLPEELDAFAATCDAIPEEPVNYGYSGAVFERGTPWYAGAYNDGMYNHVLPPNRPSCINGNYIQLGASTASSFHAQGATVLIADGHVRFVSASISRDVWREIGSRVARNLIEH